MNLAGVLLPDELSWIDEYDWSPVSQAVDYGVTGALFIQESVKLKGREITLSGTEESGFITRSVVNALKALRDSPGSVYTLTLPDFRTFEVTWKNSDPKCLDVTPVIPHNQYSDTMLYKVNALKFMEVE